MTKPITETSAQQQHEAFTLDFYGHNRVGQLVAVRSAHGDAAHMCDAIAADILAENTVRGRVTERGKLMAAAVKRAGDAIWAMREKLKEAVDA